MKAYRTEFEQILASETGIILPVIVYEIRKYSHVTIKFPNRGHKNHTRKLKILIYYQSVHNQPALVQRLDSSYKDSNLRENCSSRISLRFLITLNWFNETAPNTVPPVANFNLRNKDS